MINIHTTYKILKVAIMLLLHKLSHKNLLLYCD